MRCVSTLVCFIACCPESIRRTFITGGVDYDGHLLNDGSGMRDEYDFRPEDLRKGVRGKFADRCREGVNLTRIDPEPTEPRVDPAGHRRPYPDHAGVDGCPDGRES
jgi:hypothetical protein